MAERMEIRREGGRFWHTNCTHHFGGIMKETKREPQASLMECVRCGKSGYYPVGGAGSICADVVEQQKNVA